ncbi:MAG TPA: class I SAM-dependent methyltransferase [Terriglobales bacterium]|nr:class I SAM-dependent methyltransferase [Terriglobales bacterium]
MSVVSQAKMPIGEGPELPDLASGVLDPVSVAEGYERWAPSYDRTPNPLLAREERYLLPLLPDLHDKHVLDVACGTGRWLERLLARGTQLGVGIDFSAPMLSIARRKIALTGRLARADCLRLPFRASVFDFSVCSFALSHIQDLKQMACELARVMKSNSDVFVSDLHPEAHARGWRTGFRDGRGTCKIEALPRAAEEIVSVFYSAGFECLTHVPLCLGEPEQPMFAEAGKGEWFAERVQLPAVLVCHFRLRHPES